MKSETLKSGGAVAAPLLPRDARLPINRCNLPAVILGSVTYQQNPAPLVLDGVAELHRDLFRRLDACLSADRRAEVFHDYLTVRFCLEEPEEAGYTRGGKGRAKANYPRVLRGWSFDSDSKEGAVLKAWVESRFGLTPRFHGVPLRDPESDAYRRYQEMRCQGLYGTNALESQCDLVYTYCQYELARRHPIPQPPAPLPQAGEGSAVSRGLDFRKTAQHVTLYRGINRMDEHDVLSGGAHEGRVVLLNNLNSFTCSRDRAGEFGDYILTVDVPLTKIFFYCGLLPGILKGEDEFLVIGGAYEVEMSTL